MLHPAVNVERNENSLEEYKAAVKANKNIGKVKMRNKSRSDM